MTTTAPDGAVTTVSPVTIRPLGDDEHVAVGRLVVAAYRAVPGSSLSPGYEAELADVATRAAQAEVLVAVDEGAVDEGVIGCVTFVPDHTNPWAEEVEPGEASIRMLAVAPGAQGRGVGAALLDACLQRGRDLGREAIFLHSTSWMTGAHRLYDRAGFVRLPARDWSPAPHIPLWAYRLDLRGWSGAPRTTP